MQQFWATAFVEYRRSLWNSGPLLGRGPPRTPISSAPPPTIIWILATSDSCLRPAGPQGMKRFLTTALVSSIASLPPFLRTQQLWGDFPNQRKAKGGGRKTREGKTYHRHPCAQTLSPEDRLARNFLTFAFQGTHEPALVLMSCLPEGCSPKSTCNHRQQQRD